MSSSSHPRKDILAFKIIDEDMLYHSFMPFLKNGGLFIPTNQPYQIGEEVSVLLSLLDEPDKIPVSGTVVWVTPKGAQNNKTAGIGVQFNLVDDSKNTIRSKIETYLVDKSKSDKDTYTM